MTLRVLLFLFGLLSAAAESHPALWNHRPSFLRKASYQQEIPQGGVSFEAILWPFNNASGLYEVPCTISDDFNEYHKSKIIRWAMDVLQNGTNVRFVEKRSTDKSYLNIIDDGDCYSYTGVVFPDAQPLSLKASGPSPCISRRSALNQLMTALGLSNEHQRPDRDLYVAVQWGNILRSKIIKFTTGNNIDNGTCTPYDYASILHFNDDEYAVPGKKSLIAIKPEGTPLLEANKISPSSCDWFELNEMYPLGGYWYECKPHVMPSACVPNELRKCPKGIDCRQYCTLKCDPELCHLPGDVIPIPPRVLKRPNMKPFEGCTRTPEKRDEIETYGGVWN